MNNLLPVALPAASVLAGACVGLVMLLVTRLITAPRPTRDTFEENRRRTLRESSSTFRWFEPLIDELTIFWPPGRAADELAHHLRLTNAVSAWMPAEFMATRTLEGALVAGCLFLLLFPFGTPIFAAVLAGGTGVLFPVMARKSVISDARKRLRKLKVRLPFAIDQISLMMEAGAGFEDSLRTVVADNPDHPLCCEFAEVTRQMSLGRPRAQALNGLRDRLQDDDISEIVFAITKGEELGTPLSSILREQASQMRLKRSQWGEKAASEAEVQMVFPGMITMVACLLVIVAPILLPVLVSLLEA